MSKGNINYKYLRRRKSWFRRNLATIIAIILIIFIIAVCGIIASMKIFNYGLFKSAETQPIPVKTQEETTTAKDVVWIEDKEIVEEKVNYTPPEDVQLPYFIMVNRAANCVTVYGIDKDGAYTIPVIAFAASCGREGNETIVGENYTTTDKYEWRLMVDGTYGHYAFRIDEGYLFHSVPYMATDNNTLEEGEFNKLGSFASLGCVRMCVRDVKWLYDNCPSGTKVTIYDNESNPGPLGKPETIKIPEDSPNKGWDPTDPNENNPWLKSGAAIKNAKNITTKIGVKVDLKKGVTAVDTCGNDISAKIQTIGKYTFDKAGEYEIKYKVTDAIGSTATETIKLIVEE